MASAPNEVAVPGPIEIAEAVRGCSFIDPSPRQPVGSEPLVRWRAPRSTVQSSDGTRIGLHFCEIPEDMGPMDAARWVGELGLHLALDSDLRMVTSCHGVFCPNGLLFSLEGRGSERGLLMVAKHNPNTCPAHVFRVSDQVLRVGTFVLVYTKAAMPRA